MDILEIYIEALMPSHLNGLIRNLRDPNAILLVREVFQTGIDLAEPITNLARLTRSLHTPSLKLFSLLFGIGLFVLLMRARGSSEDLIFPALESIKQTELGNPGDLHTGTTAGLDTGNRVFKDKTLLWLDLGLSCYPQLDVDGLQCQQIDIGKRLASSLSDPRGIQT
jgi:hypothetical protein